MFERLDAVEVSSANAGEGKEDAPEPDVKDEYESGEDMTGL